MSLLITGTSGFIGSSLLLALKSVSNRRITAVVRSKADQDSAANFNIVMSAINQYSDWSEILCGVNTVIHLAGSVHVMRNPVTDPLTEFRSANTTATINLAQQAATAGVCRLIYLSSIKVNGETTALGYPFKAEDTLNSPCHLREQSPDSDELDPYAQSKQEAEQGLRSVAQQTGLEIVIIRPPLVYGAGVKGNFLQIMSWLHKGIPLPLGNIHNQRSLVALPNLIDLITTCIDHPAAANKTFLVSDGEDLSTTELLQRLSHALGKPARLLPIPQSWLETTLNLLGKHAIAQRLCGNLQVDISKTRDLLGWTPPVSVDEALRQTAQAYLKNHH
ncbi:MAG: hypothetical protein RLZZ215_263 [Pseudomonadota bacterium]|jgi:UDP-glucose 4-epimerase